MNSDKIWKPKTANKWLEEIPMLASSTDTPLAPSIVSIESLLFFQDSC